MATTPAFLFDLDGTLVDSVYQHVLAWREALEAAGIELSVWRIHRRIGMSGGLLVNGLVSPLIYLPALAPRLAAAMDGEPVPELEPFAPSRLLETN